MNLKLSRLTLVLFLGLPYFTSCSNDDLTTLVSQEENLPVSRSTSEKGRFDSEPFQWDYFISTNPEKKSSDEFVVYPVKIQEDATPLTRSNTNRRRGETGSSSRRPGGTRPSYTDSTTTSNILISDPNIIYVGAAFPESEFGKNFSKELLYPRNPIDISTSFPDSYIGEITKETGSLGYKKFLKEVLKSSEYKNFIQNGGRESLDFQCTEFFSYSDISKAFSSNAGLANIFSAKVQSNSHKTNIKSRLLGQLISKNFTVTMEVPANGFFKDKSKDSSSENPVYVRSISYGKIALLAIESEYSFEEVKKAVEAGIKWKIFNAGGSFSAKDTEILQKSTITLYLISDDTKGEANQFFNSLDDIQRAFKINYSESNFGLPIFCKGFYTKDNSIFKITTSQSTRPRRRDQFFIKKVYIDSLWQGNLLGEIAFTLHIQHQGLQWRV